MAAAAGSWDCVDPYLSAYCKTPITLVRYRTIWRNFSAYLAERQISAPAQLTRTDCLAYFDWRSHPDRANGKYRACLNTVHIELKIVGLLMREAVRRELALFNPVYDLGVKGRPVKEKPELTDEHLAEIQTAIENEPPSPNATFLTHSFQIARYQGCRLRETPAGSTTTWAATLVIVPNGLLTTTEYNPPLVNWMLVKLSVASVDPATATPS